MLFSRLTTSVWGSFSKPAALSAGEMERPRSNDKKNGGMISRQEKAVGLRISNINKTMRERVNLDF